MGRGMVRRGRQDCSGQRPIQQDLIAKRSSSRLNTRQGNVNLGDDQAPFRCWALKASRESMEGWAGEELTACLHGVLVGSAGSSWKDQG